MVTTALYMAAETKPRYSWVTGGGFSPWTTIVRTAMASQVLITAGSRATRGVAWAGLVSAAGVASSSAATMTTAARLRIPLRMELPPNPRASRHGHRPSSPTGRHHRIYRRECDSSSQGPLLTIPSQGPDLHLGSPRPWHRLIVRPPHPAAASFLRPDPPVIYFRLDD